MKNRTGIDSRRVVPGVVRTESFSGKLLLNLELAGSGVVAALRVEGVGAAD